MGRSGKLGVEPKDRMKARGLASPDRADAVLGCIACGGGIGSAWEYYQQISRPSMGELYEEANAMAEHMALPGGMDAGC